MRVLAHSSCNGCDDVVFQQPRRGALVASCLDGQKRSMPSTRLLTDSRAQEVSRCFHIRHGFWNLPTAAQVGTHEELLRKEGYYSSLINSQGLALEGRRIDVAASYHEMTL